MNKRVYTISEIAKLAGVTVRTIRYYISEGLLPPPAATGQSERYDESYLYRLELILRLKAEYLPLDKIRELLNALSDDVIRQEIEEAYSPEATPDSAQEYIRNILHPASPSSLNQRLSQKLESPRWEQPLNFTDQSVLLKCEMRIPTPAQRVSSSEERWLRYRICDDVELHVRESPRNSRIRARLPEILSELEQLCRE